MKTWPFALELEHPPYSPVHPLPFTGSNDLLHRFHLGALTPLPDNAFPPATVNGKSRILTTYLLLKDSLNRLPRRGHQVNLQFHELQQIIRDRNEITMVALECTAFVLDRVRDLHPELQNPMLTLLVKLISKKQDADFRILN